jgi:DNA-binding transcriptional LysR family regulator
VEVEMDVQQLRHLLAVVKYGNMLKAAEESHISQSGLSRSIKGLENRLGVPLLVRKSKGVEPTVYGLSLLRRAKVIISEVAHSIAEIRAIEQAVVGTVTIGITPNYAHHLVPRVIADIANTKPGVRIVVVVASFMQLVEKLKVGDIDLAFGLLGAIEKSPDIHVDEICESHSRVIARAAHPLARKGAATLAELSQARWAMLNGEGFQRNFVNFFYVRGQTIPTQSVQTDSIALLKRVIADADLLTVLPEESVRQEIASGQLVALKSETPAEFARVGFLFRAESLTTPQMQAVTDRLRAALNESGQVQPTAPATAPAAPSSAAPVRNLRAR